MDHARFDSLARALAGASTRRAALLGAFAALLPLAGTAKPGRNRDKRDRTDAREHRPKNRDAQAGNSGGGEASGEEPRVGNGRTGDRTRRGPSDAACLAVGQRCGKESGKRGKNGKGRTNKNRKAAPCTKCCSRHAVAQSNGARRCACKPAGTAATNAAQCCSGRLSAGGFCGACDPGLTECSGGCADLQTNLAHCGRCSVACAGGQRCADGQCVCDPTSCPDGCCDRDGSCRPGTANVACGTGGAACVSCDAPETCGGGDPGTPGTCGCTPDANACAGKNCGVVTDACGVEHRCGPDACGDGYSCAGNVCTCPDGNAVCAGDCCAAGEVCRNGSGECCTAQGKAAACAGRTCGTATDSCTGATYQCAPDGDDCTQRGYACTDAGQCECPGGRAVCPASGMQTCCAIGAVCGNGNGACCQPDADACAGRVCGTVTDACGVVHQCGSSACAGCCDEAAGQCVGVGAVCGNDAVCTPDGCEPCGGDGQYCCPGPTNGTFICGDGLGCTKIDGEARCAACGGNQEACCFDAVNVAFTCDQGLGCTFFSEDALVCEPCGAPGQPCCVEIDFMDPTKVFPSCDDGAVCDGFFGPDVTCVACGAAGQACCSDLFNPAGPRPAFCNDGFACNFNTCEPCGALGQTCCPDEETTVTCEPGLGCSFVEGLPVCAPCGDDGEACCMAFENGTYSDLVCGEGLGCTNNGTTTPTCAPCGKLDQQCCFEFGTWNFICDAGLTCEVNEAAQSTRCVS